MVSVAFFIYMFAVCDVFHHLYFIKKWSDKTKYAVGCVLGAISVLILIVRNIDIYSRSGWDLEVIPLQVCHIGSLVEQASVCSFAILGLCEDYTRKIKIQTAAQSIIVSDSLDYVKTLLIFRDKIQNPLTFLEFCDIIRYNIF